MRFRSVAALVVCLAARAVAAQSGGFLSFSTKNVQNFYESAGSATVIVERSDSHGTTSFTYATDDREGVVGVRYRSSRGVLTFSPGETQKTIEIELVNEDVFRGDFDIKVNFTNPTNGFAWSGGVANPVWTIHVTDDEEPPTLSFATSAYVVSERDERATITVTRSGDLLLPVFVSWAACCKTAGDDLASGTLLFPAGSEETSRTFFVPTGNDNIYTGNRDLTLRLFNPVNGAKIGVGIAKLTILEDEPAPTATLDDFRVLEGDEGSALVATTLHVAEPQAIALNFVITSEAGTADNKDFAVVDGFLTLPAGASSAPVRVRVFGDTTPEPNETFTLAVRDQRLPDSTKRTAQGVIVNDDDGFAPAGLKVARGKRGSLALHLAKSTADAQPLPLQSSIPSVAGVPPQLVLPAGEQTINFAVDGLALGNTTLTTTLPDFLGGKTLTTAVTTYEEVALRLTPTPIVMPAGATISVTASLVPAQPLAATIAIRNSSVAALEAPLSITIPPGGTATIPLRAIAPASVKLTMTLPDRYGAFDVVVPVEITERPVGPYITAVTPASGPAAGGTTLQVSGINFNNSCVVRLGDLPVASQALVNGVTMSAVTAPHEPGPVDVTVVCGEGEARLHNGFTFAGPVPSLASVSPAFGNQGGGTVVRATGANFRSGCWLFAGDTPAHGVAVLSPTMITASMPAHAAGPAPISIRCGDDISAPGATFSYSTAEEPAPSIASIEPNAAAPGQAVSLRGIRFRPSDAIAFGAQGASVDTTLPDEHSVRVAELPAGRSGLTLADVNGRITSTGAIFTVLDAVTPEITALAPQRVAPGGELALDGRGFRPALAFRIGSASLNVIDESFTRAVVRIPRELAPGRYTIAIVAPDGRTAATSAAFDVSADAPRIGGIEPACATTDGNVAVTISGSGFAAGARVAFGGVAATGVVVVDGTTIRATAPAGVTGTARVTVTNPNGDAGTGSTLFRYYSPFDPEGGCAAGGRRRPR